MFKFRTIAIIVAAIIVYLSNTPSLLVSEPNTWINEREFENISLKAIVDEESLFFKPWEDHRNVEFYLHKLGHLIFYAMLAFFLFWKTTNIKRFFFKLALITVFAFSDEVHQYFVVGRSGRAMDFAFDMLSVIMMLLILRITNKLFETNSKNHKI